MPYRVNGQYILEGLASSFMFTIGGLGYVILDQTHSPTMPKLNRLLLIFLGFICIVVSFFTTWIFMRMKLPWVFHFKPVHHCSKYFFIYIFFCILSIGATSSRKVSQFCFGEAELSKVADNYTFSSQCSCLHFLINKRIITYHYLFPWWAVSVIQEKFLKLNFHLLFSFYILQKMLWCLAREVWNSSCAILCCTPCV